MDSLETEKQRVDSTSIFGVLTNTGVKYSIVDFSHQCVCYKWGN